jgi:hypothetical protein
MAVAVLLRQLHGHAQRAAARDDGDLVHRIGLGQQLGDHGVAGLVVGGVAALLLGHDHRAALGAHHDLVLGALEVVHVDQALVAARGEQRRLVDQVGQVGAGEARRAAGDDVGLDVGRHRHLAHVHHEDLLAAADVRQRHHHLAVEAARAQQRRIEHVGTVGGGDDDDAGGALEAVHLDQQLVERLLALVVAAAEAGAALAADRVDLVDEDDAGRVLLGLLEHVAHARGADADEHLDEVGAGNREERHLGLAGDGLGQQRLAGAGGADHQHAARNASAELLELGRIAQELDQFGHFFLGLVAAGDVGEGDGVGRLVEHARALLPNEKAPPLPPPCIWRMKKIQTPISSSIGNQETKMFMRKDCSSSGLATTLTLFLSRSLTIHRSAGA